MRRTRAWFPIFDDLVECGVLKRRSREVLRAGELTDTELGQIAKTEMDPRHDHLDRELE
jgi:hypothetical protein